MNSVEKPDVCVVCFREIDVYAVGICEHKICHECSTRLRVLCKQNECPICRCEMPKVFFSVNPCTYVEASLWKDTQFNDKFKICFRNEVVHLEFSKLMQHSCPDCAHQTFRTFINLKDHMRREHEKYFCELCVQNLLIFTFERKVYNRKELARHRRVGDPDNTSHRGHPLCQFCDHRFMDSDELYRHLRKDHFFCHFCDADCSNQYYGDYDLLRKHFRDNHFLCEEDDCYEEKFTSVFRSEIDFKAHKSQHHSKSMSKAQAKQARTLEIEFAITPRSNKSNGVTTAADYGDSNDGTRQNKSSFNGRNNSSTANRSAVGIKSNVTTISPSEFPASPPQTSAKPNGSVNTYCEKEFPRLDGNSSENKAFQDGNSKTLANRLASHNMFSVRATNGSVMNNDEDFPSLSSKVTVQAPVSVNMNYSRPNKSSPHRNQGRNQVLVKFNNQDDFPALSKSKTSQKDSKASGGNLSIKVSKNVPVTVKNDADTVKMIDASKKRVSSKQNITLQSPPLLDPINIVDDSHPLASYGGTNQSIPSIEDFPVLCNGTGVSSAPSSLSKEIDRSATDERDDASFVKVKSNKKIKKSSGKNDQKKGPSGNAVNVCKRNPSENQENIRPKKIIDDDKSLSSDVNDNDANDCHVSIIEFPTLGSLRPPPGFNTTVSRSINTVEPIGKSSANVDPPPGFVNDIRDCKTNRNYSPSITFTNSCGQDYSMDQSYKAYTQPENFKDRNRRLIQTVRNATENDERKFDVFKSLSGQFRSGCLSSKEYHRSCVQTLGVNNFMKFFPELLVLLPDIEKQQQLLKVHKEYLKSQAETRGAKPKDKSWTAIDPDVIVCAACQQVLASVDFRNHMILHNLDSNFPCLPTPGNVSDNVETHISWTKKN